MAYVARKPFTHGGVKYRPGDVVQGFPEAFFRSEGLIRTGFIVERADEPKPRQKKAKAKAVVLDFPVAEPVTVEEELVDQ